MRITLHGVIYHIFKLTKQEVNLETGSMVPFFSTEPYNVDLVKVALSVQRLSYVLDGPGFESH